jgi:hypothetical protein
MAHAIQWQAIFLSDKGVKIIYPDSKNRRAADLEMEQVLNG